MIETNLVLCIFLLAFLFLDTYLPYACSYPIPYTIFLVMHKILPHVKRNLKLNQGNFAWLVFKLPILHSD